MIRSPIKILGGKGRFARRIIALMPPHQTYVEPFGGGASVLLAKPPSPVEVYSDIDGDLANLFKVIRDPRMFKDFQRAVALTPYSREEHHTARASMTGLRCDDRIEWARQFFVIARQSFSGRKKSPSWGYAITCSKRHLPDTVACYLRAVEGLPAVAARLLRVQIECADYVDVIERFDTPETLFYCDPPYVASTRRNGKYPNEMTDADHEELVQLLLDIQGMAIVSGYEHRIYKRLEDAGWRRRNFETTCQAVGKSKVTGIAGGKMRRLDKRVESLWIHPRCDAQEQLFGTTKDTKSTKRDA